MGKDEVSNSAGDHKAESSNANERFAVRIDVAEPGQNGNESNSSQGLGTEWQAANAMCGHIFWLDFILKDQNTRAFYMFMFALLQSWC
ncbi:hypothetical protein MKW92_053906 [Papaver armeniacum]|nr:hypothetical protein MKW92_053906 [Papaver armeniacum]